MKKGLIILCLLLIPATLFASAFGFRAGAVMKYDKSLGDLTEVTSVEDISFPGDFGFGGNVNIKALFADADITGYFGSDSENMAVIDGLISLNTGLDVANFRITGGVGFAYVYQYETSEVHLKGYTTQTSFMDELKDSPIHLRVAAGVDLGQLNLTIFGVYNTDQTINNFKITEIFDGFDWKSTQVGVALSYDFVK